MRAFAPYGFCCLDYLSSPEKTNQYPTVAYIPILTDFEGLLQRAARSGLIFSRLGHVPLARAFWLQSGLRSGMKLGTPSRDRVQLLGGAGFQPATQIRQIEN